MSTVKLCIPRMLCLKYFLREVKMKWDDTERPCSRRKTVWKIERPKSGVKSSQLEGKTLKKHFIMALESMKGRSGK